MLRPVALQELRSIGVGPKNDSKFLNIILVHVFGSDVLSRSSVTGTAARSVIGAKPAERLDPDKLDLIKSKFLIFQCIYYYSLINF